jgi:hypothetical protein
MKRKLFAPAGYSVLEAYYIVPELYHVADHIFELCHFRFHKLAAGTYPQATIERLMKSKPKIERFRLKDKDIYKAALQLTNFEKNEGRRKRKKKKRRGQKKLNREVAMKNDADAVVSSDSDKMLIQVAGKSKNTGTSSVTQTVKVNSDPGVTDECVPKEAVNIRVTESNSEDGQKGKKEIEENSFENAIASPGMKRKCGLFLTELENVDVGLQQLKVRRRESPKSLKVGKDKKNEMSRKKRAGDLAAKSPAAGSRMSVGGDWKVSDVVETAPKVM